MSSTRWFALALVCCLLWSGTTQAYDLLDAYRQALAGDADYQAARATAAAARESLPQARASLLPQISASASRSSNETDQTSPNPYTRKNVNYNYRYTAKTASIGLRQPLLRLGNVANYLQAGAQVDAAEHTLAHDSQSLVLRTAGAYFDVLVARAKLASVRVQLDAYAGQLASATRSFKAGFGTRTDIDDAKARADIAGAQEIQAKHDLDVAERTLAGILNQRVQSDVLACVDPQKLQLQLPQPASLDAWISRAEEENPELLAMRSNIEVAEREVQKGRAAHLPTLDLVASRSNNNSDSNTTIGSDYWTNSLGLQLNIPIYAGGQINSAVRQALANLDKTRQQYEAGRRRLGIEIAKEYGAVEHGVMRVKALEQALHSAEQDLLSTRKGVTAGTRNSVDVLNALQQLSDVRFQLTQGRTDYVLAWLKLRAAAGSLGEGDVEEVNRWLASSAECR